MASGVATLVAFIALTTILAVLLITACARRPLRAQTSLPGMSQAAVAEAQPPRPLPLRKPHPIDRGGFDGLHMRGLPPNQTWSWKRWGRMAASASSEGVCEDFRYMPSEVESSFREHSLEYTESDLETLCGKMGDWRLWLQANNEPRLPVPALFSRLCKPGRSPQLLEPLVGILRSPRMFCSTMRWSKEPRGMGDEDWWVVGDDSLLQPGGVARLYDAGATRFSMVLLRLLEHYERRGVVFDEVYAWEYKKVGLEPFWKDTPAALRRKWEPKLTFHDGVGVVADANSENNPVSLIHRDCKPEDFCVFKLDIDTPRIERALVRQLQADPRKTAGSLDEFFFEHHVKSKWMGYFWGSSFSGWLVEDFKDSYELFSSLRELGVRAHSWN